MTAMKKIALAISTDAPAMPPKPRTPAISAMIRNVTTQLNMVLSSWARQRPDPVRTMRGWERQFRSGNAENSLWDRNEITPGFEAIKPVKSAGFALYDPQSLLRRLPFTAPWCHRRENAIRDDRAE